MRTFAQVIEQLPLVAEREGLETAQAWFFDKLVNLPVGERLNNLYRVHAKSSSMVPFRMNSQQTKYWDEHQTNHFTLILKSRQIGFTTFSCVRAFDKALFEAGSRCGIMAHKVPNVTEIFKIVRNLHDCFMEDWGAWVPLVTTGDSRVELELSHIALQSPVRLGSSVKVAHDFKGYTLNFLHVSEAAFIETQRVTEALQCVPYNGWCVWETTPNGMAGAFYDTWQASRKGDTVYKRFFAPWPLFYPETDDPVSDEVVGPLSAKEQEVRRKFDVSNRAVNWRRNVVTGLGGNENEFERLYPSDEVLCFFSGEDNIFPAYLLAALSKKVSDPKIGELVEKGAKWDFVEDAAGRFLLWEKPRTAVFYVMGVDTSEGVGNDATCGYVKNRMNGSVDACLYGQLDVDEAAECTMKLAKYYNHAYVNVEVNNHGAAVIECMRKRGWGKFYKRRAIDHVTGRQTKIIGFKTTKDEKSRIIQNLKVALREARIRPKDPLLLEEMSSFICDKLGRYCARSSAHDDRVMAAALTEEMDAALPPPQDELGEMPEQRFDAVTGMPL